MATYGLEITLRGVSFDDALGRAVAALKEQGFGILTEIDVQATLKQKLGAEFRRYRILGACNPPLAKQALEADPQIGLLLPCNVVVQDAPAGDGVVVSIADPRAMFGIVDEPRLLPVVEEAERRVKSALAAIAG